MFYVYWSVKTPGFTISVARWSSDAVSRTRRNTTYTFWRARGRVVFQTVSDTHGLRWRDAKRIHTTRESFRLHVFTSGRGTFEKKKMIMSAGVSRSKRRVSTLTDARGLSFARAFTVLVKKRPPPRAQGSVYQPCFARFTSIAMRESD